VTNAIVTQEKLNCLKKRDPILFNEGWQPLWVDW